MNLFKKAAVFTDLHLGLKSNSIVHNIDCLDFIKWFVELAQNNNCETCLFLGDYFHNRNVVNLQTMQYGLDGLRLLSHSFEKVIMIPGNHDEYFKDNRTINSIAWAEHIPRVQILNEITQIGNTVFAPWLMKGEHTKLKNYSSEYLFGHFELPDFVMTGNHKMPRVGEFYADQLGQYGSVFTGHFHKRQRTGNVKYMGNAFPHNYGDAGDTARGAMILEFGSHDETYVDWPGMPRYTFINLSDLDESLLLPKTYMRATIDLDITYEEANGMKESLMKEYDLREISLINPRKNFVPELGETARHRSIDEIVYEQINKLDSEFFDAETLLNIYRGLEC